MADTSSTGTTSVSTRPRAASSMAIPMINVRSSRRVTTSTACWWHCSGSAQHSIVVNMFGYDDDELNKIIQSKLADEKVYVQMSLDRSQAGRRARDGDPAPMAEMMPSATASRSARVPTITRSRISRS